MSILFEASGRLVWSPSPRVAKCFIAQLQAVEQAEEIPSGLSDLGIDEVTIDVDQLKLFVMKLAGQINSLSSATYKSLIGGVFSIAAGLLGCCDRNALSGLSGDAGRLAQHGEALVSGRGHVGPIYTPVGDNAKVSGE
jgi:hypothetical protein